MSETPELANILDASEILPGLVLGPMPSTREFVRSLTNELNVKAIVSLQTNVDLLTLGYNWNQMSAMLRDEGIVESRRVPIPDFDERSLALSLTEAVDTVTEVRDDRQLGTYVHCTAGVNRSPTVVIGYLMAHQGYDIDSAWNLVHERRRVLPLRSALERWIEFEKVKADRAKTA